VGHVVLPPRSPNLNPYYERFECSITEDVLNQMLMLGERSLSYAIHQYMSHSMPSVIIKVSPTS
jgi:hypothetical protein